MDGRGEGTGRGDDGGSAAAKAALVGPVAVASQRVAEREAVPSDVSGNSVAAAGSSESDDAARGARVERLSAWRRRHAPVTVGCMFRATRAAVIPRCGQRAIEFVKYDVLG